MFAVIAADSGNISTKRARMAVHCFALRKMARKMPRVAAAVVGKTASDEISALTSLKLFGACTEHNVVHHPFLVVRSVVWFRVVSCANTYHSQIDDTDTHTQTQI